MNMQTHPSSQSKHYRVLAHVITHAHRCMMFVCTCLRVSHSLYCVQLQPRLKRWLYRNTYVLIPDAHTQMIGGLTAGRIIVQSFLTNPPHIKWLRVRFKTVWFSKTELDRAWYVETGKCFQSAITPLQVKTHSSLLSAEFSTSDFIIFKMLFLWDHAIFSSKLSVLIVWHTCALLIQI